MRRPEVVVPNDVPTADILEEAYMKRCPFPQYVAQAVFEAAETQEGLELQMTAAKALAQDFPHLILEADIDIPELAPILDGQPLMETDLSPLAQFLLKAREQFGDHRDSPRKISHSWITFANLLAVTDPELHDLILDEMTRKYSEEEIVSDQEMEAWEGMMGGYGFFDKVAALQRVIAQVLTHFPDIVVSKLQRPLETVRPVNNLRPRGESEVISTE